MKKTVIILSVIALMSSCGQATKKQTENAMPSQSYVGLWRTADNPPNELIILGIDSIIRFEINILRRVNVEGTAKVEGDKITFVTGNGFGGTMKFHENGISFSVEESDFGYLKVGEKYDFTVKVEKEQPKNEVRHYYKDAVYGVVFFDGDKACAERYGIKGNLEDAEPNAVYKEFSNYLQIDDTKFNFFDDWGHILPEWQIINHRKVHSRFQITDLEPETAKISAKDIQEIKETCLIFIVPKDAYEEWAWYEDDRKQEYAAKGITSVRAEKRYLSFTIADNEKIVIDTKKEQNGTIPPSALLYRKGYIPIMISISGESEEGNKMIEEYLQK